MSFLFPLGWLFLGLMPIIVALYLRRIRRRDLAVPTLLFWQKALGEQNRRAFLGRLRQWLSLALQLLILLLIILALVRPISSGLPGGQHSTVLVVDTRARMQALEPGGESRFAKAVAVARRHASGARENAPVAILAAGAFPEVAAPFQDNGSELGATLDALRPTDASGDLAPAIALARELLAARPGTHELVVISDGSDFPESLGPEERVSVGTRRENVAITRFSTRPQVASPHTVDLLLSLAHYGSEPVEGTVEIWSEESLLDVKPFKLAPNEQRTEIFPALPAEGEQSRRLRAKLQISGDDALVLDNEAYAVLPAAQPLRVLLVTRGNWFLEKALPADPGVRFELLSPEAFKPEMSEAFDVVIYDGTGPKDLDALSTLKGNALFLKESPFTDIRDANSDGGLKEPLITERDSAHPLLRWVEWSAVTFFNAARLTTPELEGWQFQTPLQSFEHPLILTGEHEGQRIAAFAFDVGESDLPLRIAFPLLISNTLQWLARGDAALPPTSLECGKALPLQPGETFSSLSDEAEGAAALPIRSEESASTIGKEQELLQPLQNGFYAIHKPESEGGEEQHIVAVNTFSTAESNLTLAPEKAASPLVGAGDLLQPLATRPLWHWFAMAAFVLLSLEWWLYHRRVTE